MDDFKTPQKKQCPNSSCNGGTIHVLKNLPCSRCHGAGDVEDQSDDCLIVNRISCPAGCSSGWVVQSAHETCNVCGGAGYIYE